MKTKVNIYPQLAGLGFGLLAMLQTHADTIVWTNTSGGNWNVATHWQPNQVPDAGDTAVITNNGTYSVTLNISPTVAGLTLGGSTGTQTLVINGTTLTLDGAATANTNAVVEFNGGIVTGSGEFAVNGLLNWTGGTMTGSGATVIPAGGVMNITGSATKTLDGRSVTNLGTVVWSGTGKLYIQNGTPFYNQPGGLFEVQNDALYEQDIFTAGGSFHNAGLLRKTAGPGTTTWQGVTFENRGTVETLSGRFLFPNGVSSSGSFLVGTGATNVFNGICSFASGSVLSGAGQNRLESVTVTLDGVIGATNLVLVSGTWRGTNTVSGSWEWMGGTLAGPGGTTLPAGSRLDITGSAQKTLNGRAVTNLGTVVWSGTGRLFIQNGAPFYNQPGGLFDVQNDVDYEQDIWNAAGSFHNAGTFRKAAGPGTTTFQGIPFYNTGTVEVQSGTLTATAAFNNDGLVKVQTGQLVLSGGGTSSGQIELASNLVLRLTGGTHTLNEGCSWVGDGTFQIAGGTVSAAGAAGVERMELSSGTLSGSSTLTVTNVLNWTGGTMAGSGATVIPAGGVMNITGSATKTLDGRSVTNLGTVVWSGTGKLYIQNGTPFYNQPGGLFEVQNDALYEQDIFTAGGSFHNAGLLRKTAGPGTTTWQGVTFENRGTVETLSGRFLFPNGVSSSGSFLVGTGATNVFNGICSFASGSVLSGAGQNRLESVTVTLDGVIGATNLVLVSGTWRGTNTVSGSWEWMGGTLAGPGGTTLPAGSRLDITGSAQKTLNGRAVTNLGTVVWSGTGRLFIQNGAPFYNQPGGLFDVQNDVDYEQDIWNAAGSFHNAGTFRKAAGPGTTTFQGIPFYNTGTMSVWQGVLNFSEGLNLSSAGTLEFPLTGVNHPADYGRITTSKALPLAGRLAVSFRNGFVPGSGQEYDIVAAPVSGVFQSYLVPPISPDVFINPAYKPNALQLVVSGPTPSLPQPAMDAQGYFTMKIHGIVNQLYVVEASTNLHTWTPLATNAIPASTIWLFVDQDSLTIPFRVYRVMFHPQNVPPSGPLLAITRHNNVVMVSWPIMPEAGWLLHATTNLLPGSGVWTEIPPPYQTNDANLQFTEPAPTGNRFYRLFKP